MILGFSKTSYIGILGKGNKTQTDKLYFMKIEIWYFKDHNRSKKDSEDCEKIFENHMSDKGLISGISREL